MTAQELLLAFNVRNRSTILFLWYTIQGFISTTLPRITYLSWKILLRNSAELWISKNLFPKQAQFSNFTLVKLDSARTRLRDLKPQLFR